MHFKQINKMDRVGHKDSNITNKIYLHVTSGMRKDATEKMHKRFTQLLSDNRCSNEKVEAI